MTHARAGESILHVGVLSVSALLEDAVTGNLEDELVSSSNDMLHVLDSDLEIVLGDSLVQLALLWQTSCPGLCWSLIKFGYVDHFQPLVLFINHIGCLILDCSLALS